MTKPGRMQEISTLMREVLGESYTHLIVKRVLVEEDLEGGKTSVTCEVDDENAGVKSVIAGKGVGMVDALLQAMLARFGEEYPSLKTIRLYSFSVRGQLDTKKGYSGADSLGEVTLEIANSEDRLFAFADLSRSVISSMARVTLMALEHFINAERAFVSLHHALQDAKARHRADLVQRFTNSMATLVKNTSYSEVISRLREDIKE